MFVYILSIPKNIYIFFTNVEHDLIYHFITICTQILEQTLIFTLFPLHTFTIGKRSGKKFMYKKQIVMLKFKRRRYF